MRTDFTVDHLTIETPEQIPLEFLLAGIGSRFLALALDTVIQALAGMVLLLVGIVIVGVGPIGAPRSGPWALAALVLGWFLVQFAYFAFFEAIWNGQTPGKRYLHLRVIKESGHPLSAYEAISRNLVRIVDSLPGIYAVGIVAALVSRKSKRLGDYVAGTVVVHEKPLAQQAEISWDSKSQRVEPAPPVGSVLRLAPSPPPVEAPPTPTRSGYDAGRLSPEEFKVMEAFLLRRGQLAADVRASMARKITERIAPKLDISEDDRRNPEKLLEALVTEYRSQARFR